MLKYCLVVSLLLNVFGPVVRAQDVFGELVLEDDQKQTEAVALDDLVVVASRNPVKWLDTKGTVTRADSETMVETGVQDLGGIVKYDPTVVVPFDMTTGDGAVAYAATGSASFNIRGIEGNRVGVEVDGIRQPPEYVSTSFDAGAETGAGGMGRDYFDPSMFQLVEILKGGASALYGSDAMGGVISMKTLEPVDLLDGKEWGGLARTQYFSRNEGIAWQLGGAGASKNFDYMLMYAGREGNETDNNGFIPPDPMSMTSESWLGKIGYHQGDHRFKFTFEHYNRDIYAEMRSALHPSIAMFNIFKNSIENWQDVERDRISLQWIYEPVGGWLDKVETQVYRQESSSSSRNLSTNARSLAVNREDLPVLWRQWIALYNPTLMVDGRNRRQNIDFETDITGMTSFATKDLEIGGWRNRLLGGIDISQEKSSNRFDRVETNGTVVPDLTGPPGTFYEELLITNSDRISFAPSETNRLGIFIQDEIELGKRWDISFGLRADYHEIKTDLNQQYMARIQNALGSGMEAEASSGYDNFSISPRLDIGFKATDRTRLYAGYGMGIRNPTAEELTMIFDHPAGNYQQVTVPNPDLQEEVSHAFKIGYKGEGAPGRFGVELFYTKYQDFVENNVPVEILPDGTVVTTAINQGDAEIYGIEMSSEWNIGDTFDRLTGLSLGLSSGKTVGNNKTKGEPINTIEPWKTVGWFGYQDPDAKYGARLIGTYTAEMNRTDDTTMNGKMFHPPSWFTLDFVAWWKPVDGLTLNAGVNNIFDEQYWNWGTVRRGGGHLGLDSFGGQESSVDDRTTASGTNFYLSATYTF